MKALVVVAHPDDHVLWAGGTILKMKQWEWHVLSLCNSHYDDFDPKDRTFRVTCKELGVRKFDAKKFNDHQKEVSNEQILKFQNEILGFADREYDLVFTHSNRKTGEYGFHANHKEVCDSVDRLIDKEQIKVKALFCFCYKSGGANKPVIADLSNADYKVNLTTEEKQKKKELKQIFDWAKGDLKALTLWDNEEPKTEAFNFRKFKEIALPPDFIKLGKT